MSLWETWDDTMHYSDAVPNSTCLLIGVNVNQLLPAPPYFGLI